ncbi:polyprotein [Phytophthora megakarya]|uniref:Polyprotein n=1 Tax=Phytophthora megakarya TaxID=4795 RepID=A0A225UW13_9STRA|nr:polyprotein [Phytophthora megakarya]
MAKRVLRYLAGTESYGLVVDMNTANNVELVGCTDVDYAYDTDDRVYTRYRLWLIHLCEEIIWTFATPEIRGDNKSCIYVTVKPGKHSKTKNIQKKFHVVCHLVEKERLWTRHVGINDMIADAMTKPLSRDKLERCQEGMKVLRIDRVQTSDRSQVTLYDSAVHTNRFKQGQHDRIGVIVLTLHFNMIPWE